MALPKNKRKIIVNDQTYFWIAKGNPEKINLTVENSTRKKLFAKFDYNTLNEDSSYFVFPFIVTPYIVRKTILYALKNGYTANKDCDIGNMSKEVRKLSLVKRKIVKIMDSIAKRTTQDHKNIVYVETVLKDTKDYINYGELLLSLENMIDNLYEIDFEFNQKELTLLKNISEMYDIYREKIWEGRIMKNKT